MLKKLTIFAVAAAFIAAPLPSFAQAKKDSVVMAMALEPPGLDPTNAAAAAIAEVTLYNIYETLTKINEDGSVSPLLAESWQASPDLKTYTFKLRKGVKFQNGEAFDSAAVKFSYDRNAAATSTNKDKSLYQSFESVTAPDADTIVIALKYSEPNLPFLLGQASGSIVEPKSAPTNVTQPVGTGPYQLGGWVKGSSITLNKWADYRNASAIKLSKVTIRFISDPAAQIAALLSGDVDAFPRVATRSVAQLKADPRFTVLVGGSKAKTIVAINERKKPLDDVRVRRAILAAIDRKAMIDGAADGFGTPIGSFYTPGSLGFVDTTGINPYDPEKAKQLLKEAGVTNLELSLKLPPPPYARAGGEILAAQLAKVGITAKIENVEWAQWLSQVFAGTGPHNFDLTIVSHVEPFDLVKITESDYYLGYNNEAFNTLYKQIMSTPDEAGRAKLLGDAQKMLATDAVAGFLYQPQWPTVINKKLKGVWKEVPQFENDFSAWSWE
ncbi:ABC transporter substrate-binding protein [Bradyrhizobium jicamae]|uniref:ABC transporter substrate-binding protein n=1 Tax=Bradyrhizobium jicamae TaxID=280332 RepID=UPI001BA7E6DC|nr:ABC transporter substrate-binding protein [Bradyrhizobium jicamae]MBR0750564.1 ABC transporter substrate-binding protein [Bradyrhizobium jicamae]